MKDTVLDFRFYATDDTWSRLQVTVLDFRFYVLDTWSLMKDTVWQVGNIYGTANPLLLDFLVYVIDFTWSRMKDTVLDFRFYVIDDVWSLM